MLLDQVLLGVKRWKQNHLAPQLPLSLLPSVFVANSIVLGLESWWYEDQADPVARRNCNIE